MWPLKYLKMAFKEDFVKIFDAGQLVNEECLSTGLACFERKPDLTQGKTRILVGGGLGFRRPAPRRMKPRPLEGAQKKSISLGPKDHVPRVMVRHYWGFEV